MKCVHGKCLDYWEHSWTPKIDSSSYTGEDVHRHDEPLVKPSQVDIAPVQGIDQA